MVRLIAPIVMLSIGIIYFILSLNVQISHIGHPHSPKFFPVLIATTLIIMSLIYFFQELRQNDQTFESLKVLFSGIVLKRILATCLMILVYALIFERIGFLISTILFLGSIMFLINGIKHWLKNVLVAIIFSGVAWYTFSVLLNVSLP